MLLGAVPIGARRSIHPRVGAKLSVGPSVELSRGAFDVMASFA